MAVIIGTSGWQYRDWRGPSTRRSCRSGCGWSTTSQYFATVESNNAFYRLPELETFEKWRERTPPDFRWAVKASRFLTHIKRLREPRGAGRPADGAGRRARHKLDTILLQLPPTLKADAGPAARVPRAVPGRHPGRRRAAARRAGGPTRSARCSSGTAPRCAGPTATSGRSPRCGAPPTGATCASTTASRRGGYRPRDAAAVGRPAGRGLDGRRGRARLLQQRPRRARRSLDAVLFAEAVRRAGGRRPACRRPSRPPASPGTRPRRRRASEDGGCLGVPDAELLGGLARAPSARRGCRRAA